MKRVGVDVGGHVHRPHLRGRRGGRDPRPQAPDHARRPVAGHDRGDRGDHRRGGREPRGARPGVPRDDDRDEHRDRAQRRHGRDDHDRGLPRHPPHRPAQEAAQLLELPGPAVAGLPGRSAPLPADGARAHHEGRLGARPARRGGGARAGAEAEGGRASRRCASASSSRSSTRCTSSVSPRSCARSSPRRSSRSRPRCCRSTASTSASRRSGSTPSSARRSRRTSSRLQEELKALGVRSGVHLMTSASGVATAEAAVEAPGQPAHVRPGRRRRRRHLGRQAGRASTT